MSLVPIKISGLLPQDCRLELLAAVGGPIPSNQGPAVHAAATTADKSGYDILFVLVGAGTRQVVDNTGLLD